MGDRATLLFVAECGEDTYRPEPVGIYVHWTGEMSRVLAALDYAKDKGVRSSGDWSYGIARLTQIIANYLGGTLSIGVVPARISGYRHDRKFTFAEIEKWAADHGKFCDNGSYIIGGGFKIIAHVTNTFVEDRKGNLIRLKNGDFKTRIETVRGAALESHIEAARKGDTSYFDALASTVESNSEHFDAA